MSKRGKKLSDKETLFIESYLTHWNGSRASREAGYDTNHHSQNAADILKKPGIKEIIDARLEAVRMTANEALFRMEQMSRASIADLLEPDGVNGGAKLQIYEPDPTADDPNRMKLRDSARYIRKFKTRKRISKDGESDDEIELEMTDVLKATDTMLHMTGKYKELEVGDSNKQPAVLPHLPVDSISPEFMPVYKAMKNKEFVEYILKGGRGSTKSAFSDFAVPWLLINNPDMHALVLRQVKDTLRDSVYSGIIWAISELGLDEYFKCTVSPMEIQYIPTGQKIYFRGADEPGKIKSIKPRFGYIGILRFEELDQFRGAESVRKIEQSAIRGGDHAFIIKTYNPPRSSANWVNKYVLIPKANQLQHHSCYLNVPPQWLGKTFIAEAEHLRQTNPKAYEHEYLGIVNGTGGQIFENVKVRAITDEEIREFDNIHRGVDWGYFPDPYSYGKVHYDAARRRLFIYDEYSCYRKGNKETYDALVNEKGVQPDDLLVADSAEPKSIADYKNYGLMCRGAEKGPDSVHYSIKWLQSLSEIVIDPVRAPDHCREFVDYEYMTDPDGNYVTEYPDKDNHRIDDTRYATNPIWRKRGQ